MKRQFDNERTTNNRAILELHRILERHQLGKEVLESKIGNGDFTYLFSYIGMLKLYYQSLYNLKFAEYYTVTLIEEKDSSESFEGLKEKIELIVKAETGDMDAMIALYLYQAAKVAETGTLSDSGIPQLDNWLEAVRRLRISNRRRKTAK